MKCVCWRMMMIPWYNYAFKKIKLYPTVSSFDFFQEQTMKNHSFEKEIILFHFMLVTWRGLKISPKAAIFLLSPIRTPFPKKRQRRCERKKDPRRSRLALHSLVTLLMWHHNNACFISGYKRPETQNICFIYLSPHAPSSPVPFRSLQAYRTDRMRRRGRMQMKITTSYNFMKQ